MNKTSDAKIRATAKYNKNNTKIINFRFNLEYDADIIEFLNSKENKSGYLKKLLRDQIKKEES